jgi:hypothetical protein
MPAATAEKPDTPVAPLSLRLRAVLISIGAGCLLAFFYGNAQTEEFRLRYPAFHPWLWNLFLSCAVAGFVGALAAWWRRRWGIWTMLVAGILGGVISLYAMSLTLVGTLIVLAAVAVWTSAQADSSALH